MHASHTDGRMERRQHPRIDAPFAVRIRAVGAHGAPFTSTALLRNLSARGFLVPLPQPVLPDDAIQALVTMWNGERRIGSGLVLAIRGKVVRCNHGDHKGGAGHLDAVAAPFLVAVQFRRQRLFAVDRARWPHFIERV